MKFNSMTNRAKILWISYHN